MTIHEVGHNWFPMIVASDERKWTWMDEGLNSFLQYYAEQDWDPAYPSNRGPARNLVPCMKDADQVPIMTESDYIHRIAVENRGGLLMPVRMAISFDDGTTRMVKLGADVWRRNELSYVYGLFTDKTVVRVVLDPDEVFADINRDNNTWSKGPVPAS